MLTNRRIIVCLILTFLIGKNLGTGSERRHRKVDSLLLAKEEERKEIGKSQSLIGEKDKESPPAGTPESGQRNINDNEQSQGNAKKELAPTLLSLSSLHQQQQQSHGPQLAQSILQKGEKAPSLLPQKRQLAPSLLQQEQLTPSLLEKSEKAPSLLQQGQLAPSLLPQEKQLTLSLLQKEHEQLTPSLLQKRQLAPSLLQQEQLAPSQLQEKQMSSSLLQKGEKAPSLLQHGKLTPSLLQDGKLTPTLLEKGEKAPSLLQRKLAPSLLQKGEKAQSLVQHEKKAQSFVQLGRLAPSLLSPTVPIRESMDMRSDARGKGKMREEDRGKRPAQQQSTSLGLRGDGREGRGGDGTEGRGGEGREGEGGEEGGGIAIPVRERNRKTILVIARNWHFSHHLIMVNFVNILYSRGYNVHFVLGNYATQWKEKGGLRNIPVLDNGIMLIEMRMEGIKTMHGAITGNEEVVRAEGRAYRLWDWLKWKARNDIYALAIVDSDVIGGLDCLQQLGIPARALLSVCPLKSVYQHRLGMALPLTIPAFANAKRGDGNGSSGIWVADSRRQQENKRVYELEIKTDGPHVKKGEIRNLRLVLVNQHPLAQFHARRHWPARVKFFGGIHVEQFLAHHTAEATEDSYADWACLVLFSLGTENTLASKNVAFIRAIFAAFSAHPQCAFLVVNVDMNRLEQKFGGKAKMETLSRNVLFEQKFVSQMEILLQEKKLRAIITHCGQNSLNEAIYSGVPIVCIPLNYDQFHNAAIAEHLGIGIFVEERQIVDQFPRALDAVLTAKGSNIYLTTAIRLKAELLRRPTQISDSLIDAIDSAIFGQEDRGQNKLEEEATGKQDEKEEEETPPKFIQLLPSTSGI